MWKRTIEAGVLLLLLSGSALAQTSASFQLEEYTLNAGGTPSQGSELASASFRMTVASLGNTLSAVGLDSASFQLDSGFGVSYLPPGQVAAMCGGAGELPAVFTDVQTLIWPRGAFGRDSTTCTGTIPVVGYGICEQQDLIAATYGDGRGGALDRATTFYYLVTVENRLAEEGTKGFQSDEQRTPGRNRLAGVSMTRRGEAMTRRAKNILSWASAWLCCCAGPASAWAASPPERINFQGVLRDASGAPTGRWELLHGCSASSATGRGLATVGEVSRKCRLHRRDLPDRSLCDRFLLLQHGTWDSNLRLSRPSSSHCVR